MLHKKLFWQFMTLESTGSLHKYERLPLGLALRVSCDRSGTKFKLVSNLYPITTVNPAWTASFDKQSRLQSEMHKWIGLVGVGFHPILLFS